MARLVASTRMPTTQPDDADHGSAGHKCLAAVALVWLLIPLAQLVPVGQRSAEPAGRRRPSLPWPTPPPRRVAGRNPNRLGDRSAPGNRPRTQLSGGSGKSTEVHQRKRQVSHDLSHGTARTETARPRAVLAVIPNLANVTHDSANAVRSLSTMSRMRSRLTLKYS